MVRRLLEITGQGLFSRSDQLPVSLISSLPIAILIIRKINNKYSVPARRKHIQARSFIQNLSPVSFKKKISLEFRPVFAQAAGGFKFIKIKPGG